MSGFLIPRFDGAILSQGSQEPLRDKFVTCRQGQASLGQPSRELGIEPKTVAQSTVPGLPKTFNLTKEESYGKE